jgi:hypothetical protein
MAISGKLSDLLLSQAHPQKDNLLDSATQLAVVSASDKTCLTAMTGGLEMYLAYLTLANIISAVHMKASNHAWMSFAFLPIVKFTVHPDFQLILLVWLWHACMDKAFTRCKEAAMNGRYMADPHGCLHWSFPLLAAWTTNLPEQHLISATANNVSPLSHVTTDQFGDDICQPPHHGHETLQLICELTHCVDPWQLDNFQKEAKAIGLSGVHLPFWHDWHMAEPFHFLVPEILHMCHKFFFLTTPSHGASMQLVLMNSINTFKVFIHILGFITLVTVSHMSSK